MSVFISSFNTISPILLLAGLGWFMAWRKHLDEHSIGVLNTVCFKYLIALLVFNGTMSIDFYSDFNPRLIAACALGIFSLMVAAWLIFSLVMKNRARRCIFIMGAFRTNYVNYAIPIVVNLFGPDSLGSVVVLMPVTIILFNFFAVILMVYHSQSSESIGGSIRRTAIDVCVNPQVVGAFLGILFSLTRIQLPQFLLGGIDSIASTAVPISLLLLGAQLDLKKLAGDLRQTLAFCAVRLVITPAIMIAIMVLLGFRGAELGALMVVFSAPLAVNSVIMAQYYNIDPHFTAQTVMLSTVLSLPTMFLFISLLTALGLF